MAPWSATRACGRTTSTRLRGENFGTPTTTNAPDIVVQLTYEQLLDAIAITVDGPRAWDLSLALDITFTDADRNFRVTLSNGALTYVEKAADPSTATATISLTKPRMLGLLAGDTESEGLQIDGDASALGTLTSVLSQGDPAFNIVVP